MCVCMSLCVLARVRAIRGTQAEFNKNASHQLDKVDDQNNTILHVMVYRVATDQACKAYYRTPRVTIRFDAVG